MRALTRTVLAGALVTAGFLSSPASAEYCFGEEALYVCVTPPVVELGTKTYCVYAGDPTCKPVDAPTLNHVTLPRVECHGSAAGACVTFDPGGGLCSLLSWVSC